MVRHIDIIALIFLQCFLEEVGHLWTINASLAGKLLDEGSTDKVVVRDVKWSGSWASWLCLLSVYLDDGGSPIDTCSLGLTAA